MKVGSRFRDLVYLSGLSRANVRGYSRERSLRCNFVLGGGFRQGMAVASRTMLDVIVYSKLCLGWHDVRYR